MSKYHVSKDGKARRCNAKTPETCRATSLNMKEHYSTREEAQSAYEEKNEQIILKPLSKASKSIKTLSERADYQEELLESAIADKRSLTDVEIAERKKYVADAVQDMRKVSPSMENNYANAPYRYSGYSAERKKMHKDIVENFMNKAEVSKQEGEIVFSGGLAGAGKSTVLKEHVNIELENYVSLSADDIKEIMAEKGMIPKVKGLSPMEASALIHEESLDITDQVFEKLVEKRSNIIMDMTMNKPWSVTEKTNDIKHRGYDKIKAVFIDVDPKTSAERAGQRYVTGLNEYITTGKGTGGRYLPSAIIEAQATDSGSKYRSKNAENLLQLTEMGTFTEEPLIFDNEGTKPKEISYESFAE